MKRGNAVSTWILSCILTILISSACLIGVCTAWFRQRGSKLDIIRSKNILEGGVRTIFTRILLTLRVLKGNVILCANTGQSVFLLSLDSKLMTGILWGGVCPKIHQRKENNRQLWWSSRFFSLFLFISQGKTLSLGLNT